MILPTKHINISESLLGLGGYLLTYITDAPISIDELWNEYSKVNGLPEGFPAYHPFENIILTLNLLYIMGVINVNEKGNVVRL